MLLEMQNIAVVTVNEFGNGSIQSLAVGTLHQQDGSVFHEGSPVSEDHCKERVRSVPSARECVHGFSRIYILVSRVESGTKGQRELWRRAKSLTWCPLPEIALRHLVDTCR
jgi:hypothetical protein